MTAIDMLKRQLAWHEARRKELSKSGKTHGTIAWDMMQHQEEIDAITAVLEQPEGDSAELIVRLQELAEEISLEHYTDSIAEAISRLQGSAAQPNLKVEVSKALRRAYSLGQTYWQQADSDFPSQHKKADETQRQFEQLTADTVATIGEKNDN